MASSGNNARRSLFVPLGTCESDFSFMSATLTFILGGRSLETIRISHRRETGYMNCLAHVGSLKRMKQVRGDSSNIGEALKHEVN